MQTSAASASPSASALSTSSTLAKKSMAKNLVNCPFSKPVASRNNKVSNHNNNIDDIDYSDENDEDHNYDKAAENVAVSTSPFTLASKVQRTNSLVQRI